MAQRSFDSPCGRLTLTQEGDHITALHWGDGPRDDSALLAEAEQQVQAYFDHDLDRFRLPLKVIGSTFQQRICAVMSEIPFGDTVTYKDIANQLGVSPQAAGQGCGGNPIPLIIPCHRVLGSNGLGGFSGGIGIETKVWLLRHEGAASLLI